MPDAAGKRYRVKILPSAQRDMDDLQREMASRVGTALLALGANPRPHGAIKLTAEEGHRLRVGSYRVVYRIDDAVRIVFVYRVKHRREAYRP